MSVTTGIEWTDATWNPVRGCSRVSSGCQNCYAERVAARFAGPQRKDGEVTDTPGPFAGFATHSPPRWTGLVALVEEHLLDPLRWRKPRRIFVNSMSDLFHESLPDEAIDRVFAVMALAPRHTFQILTKRAMRMWMYGTSHYGGAASRATSIAGEVSRLCEERGLPFQAVKWPLPNVWLGVSCEDQARADERIPLLLQTPAAVRFVSAEPLLGPIELPPSSPCEYHRHDLDRCARLDWVIVGGESGPGARPCDIAWVRSIVAQCNADGVAGFVKQLGAQSTGSVPVGVHGARMDGCVRWQEDRKGGDPAEWPEDLRVREFPR